MVIDRPLDFLWLIPVLPLAGFLVAGAGCLLRARAKSVVAVVACGSVALSFVLSLLCVMALAGLPAHERSHVTTVGEWIGPLGLDWSFRLDPLSSVMILVVTGVGFLIHLYSVGYMAHEEGFWRYFAYLNLFMAMMLTLVLGASLPLLFVGWEGVGLCSYLLIGFFYTKSWCADAGRKAFLVNRIGDASFIIGMLWAWVLFGGTFDIAALIERAPAAAAASPGSVTAIALLLFGGAAGKSAQIPLYVWLPDAMAGPTPVSALIHAATMVTAGVYMVCRLSPIYVLAPDAMFVVAVVGAATALLAALIAMAQDDIKKVLAYSTISQLGYMFMAAGAGAFTASIFHLTTHAFFKALLFLGSGAVIHALHGEQDMQKMGGLKSALPRTFLCFSAGWIAIAGVPLTAGFFSKDEILYKAFLHSPLLWAAGLVGALMTAIYMTRLMGLTFFGVSRRAAHDDHDAHGEAAHEPPVTMMIPLMVLAALALTAGFVGLPAPIGALFGGHGESPFAAWLAPVFHAPEAAIAAPHPEGHSLELLLMALSSLVALFGIAAGLRIWVTRPEIADRIAVRLGAFYVAVREKLYVDELYDRFIVKPWYALSRGMGRFDTGAVDGVVNGVGAIMLTSGHVMKLFHSGYVRSYAIAYVIGAAVIVWYLL